MADDAFKRIGGLWLKDGKRGKFLTGKVPQDLTAGQRLFLFKNDRNKGDSDPDYAMFVATDAAKPGDEEKQSHDRHTEPSGSTDSIPW